eukprot:7617014-Pyramimonas_sp.AAC.1
MAFVSRTDATHAALADRATTHPVDVIGSRVDMLPTSAWICYRHRRGYVTDVGADVTDVGMGMSCTSAGRYGRQLGRYGPHLPSEHAPGSQHGDQEEGEAVGGVVAGRPRAERSPREEDQSEAPARRAVHRLPPLPTALP